MEAQMKMTDIIRMELMEYIYSDDSVEDSDHIQKILNELSAIDLRFKDLDEELKEYRSRTGKYILENHRLMAELETIKDDKDVV